MGRAMQAGVELKDLEGIFEPLRSFIKEMPKIKKTIARGPDPQHFVYLDHTNNASWTYSPNDDKRLGVYVGEMNTLKHLAAEQ